MPLVSVIIPTYNRADLISKTVDSVLAQTFSDYEVIVVDDGSQDETQAVLAKYEKHVRVIIQQNQGAGEARNTGIRTAQGEYLAFLDSDDLWFPNKLAEQMELFARSPNTLWCYSDAYFFDGMSGNILFLYSRIASPYQGFIPRQLLLCDFIASPTVVIHRAIFEEVGFFRTAPNTEDWDMWLRIAAKFPIAHLPKPLAGYRVHDAMISNRDPMILYNNYLATIDRAVAFAPEVYGALRDQATAQSIIRIGRTFANIGQADKARLMFLKAIQLDPWARDAYLYWLSCLLPCHCLRFLIRLRKYFLKLNGVESSNIGHYVANY